MNKLIYLLGFAFFASCGSTPSEPPEEELPRLSIASVTLFEGNEETTFSFQVHLSKTSDDQITVNYDTEEDTAGEGTDYIATNGTLTFAPGEQDKFIEVEIVTDEFKENDEEFRVVLSTATNATIATGVGVGTIRNEDTVVDIPDDGYITPETYPGFTLNWAEEFDGNAINTSHWTHEIGNSGWGNNELQYYTDNAANSYVGNGVLTIEAIKENFNGAPYTSARMITKDKKTFTFGRIDVRAILPEGQGIWPAIWMLGNNISDIGWPACGEIDIMELVGHEPGETHGTAHWGPQGQSWSFYKGEGYQLSANKKFSEEYHVFSILWEAGKIEWYVDDNKFFTLTNSEVNGEYPFDREFFFILNIAVGGNWPGNPDATTQFPQQMIIDYIRVFDKN